MGRDYGPCDAGRCEHKQVSVEPRMKKEEKYRFVMLHGRDCMRVKRFMDLPTQEM